MKREILAARIMESGSGCRYRTRVQRSAAHAALDFTSEGRDPRGKRWNMKLVVMVQVYTSWRRARGGQASQGGKRTLVDHNVLRPRANQQCSLGTQLYNPGHRTVTHPLIYPNFHPQSTQWLKLNQTFPPPQILVPASVSPQVPKLS